jgi:hypothetical protein
MAPLLQELLELEVEPLEVIVDAPESEQDSSLDTLTTASGDAEVFALYKGNAPVALCCCCCTECAFCCCVACLCA